MAGAHLLVCPSAWLLDVRGALSDETEMPTVARDLDSGPVDMTGSELVPCSVLEPAP